eukprot:2392302-Amphidinium_carterae.1
MSTSTSTWKDRDPPAAWDGEAPEQRWRSVRRALVLWSEDTEVPKAKQGLRLFRSLQGKAATMAELLEDDKLKGEGAFQRILTFFDDMYTQHLRLAYDQDFDKAIYSGARSAQESCMQYAVRKRTELTSFELHREAIGELIKGKVLLRHARLDSSQLQRVHTWLKGDRHFSSVFEALTKLDTELDTGMTTAKAYLVDVDEENEHYPAPESWPGADVADDVWWQQQHVSDECEWSWQPDVSELYSEQYDEGEDSDVDNVFWMHPETLAQPLDEYYLDQTYATFAEVKRQKAALRTNRGFYAQKGKGPKGPSFKGKGKGKNKGKDKGKADNDAADTWTAQLRHRHQRDQRRHQHKYVRTTREQLTSRVCCWRCQQVGHMAAQCTASKGSSGKGTSKGSYFVSSASSAPEPSLVFQHGFHVEDNAWWCYTNWTLPTLLAPETVWGVIDTGAINAVCGARTFLALDQCLKHMHLGTRQIQSPRSLGGVGGTCKVLAAAEIPITLGAGRTGLVATAVCSGEIPFLVPLTLLSSLGAQINTSEQQLQWPDGKVTKLLKMQSGHFGVPLTDKLHDFVNQCARASEFQRSAEHERVP